MALTEHEFRIGDKSATSFTTELSGGDFLHDRVLPALRYGVLTLALAAIAWPSAPPVQPQLGAGLSGSEWRVVELQGRPVPGAGTVRFTSTSVRGKAACNSFMGAFHEMAGAIEIAGLGVSSMLCDGRMDLEHMLFDALASARSYVVQGATLVLFDATGRTLVKLTG